jgi:uncharacterized protein
LEPKIKDPPENKGELPAGQQTGGIVPAALELWRFGPKMGGQAIGGCIMDDRTKEELEAAAFRRLVSHLRQRTDVQNIDMMITAGFCRNCLGDWYREAAAERGITLGKDEARAEVYGMAPEEWKARHQKEATQEQKAAFAAAQKHD